MVTLISLGSGDPDSLTTGALSKARSAKKLFLDSSASLSADYLNKCGIEFESLERFSIDAGDSEAAAQKAADCVFSDKDCTVAFTGGIYGSALAKELLRRGAVLSCTYGTAAERAMTKAAFYLDGGGVAIYTAEALGSGARFSPRSDLIVTGCASYEIWDKAFIALLKRYSPKHNVAVVSRDDVALMELRDVGARTGFCADTCVAIRPGDGVVKEVYDYSDVIDILRMLRAENGCPWDREQTHETLRPYLLEESYEVMDAIDRKNDAMLMDELGDIIMQVVFHCVIAEEDGSFEPHEVTTNLCRKLINRHPHIFGEVHVDSARDVAGNWEDIKRREKGQRSYTDALRDVPLCTSQLIRSTKIQKKAGLIGFDFDNYDDAAKKVTEELGELLFDAKSGKDPESESGDLLFAVTNLLRLLKVSPDAALNRTCNKFIDRFEYMEKAAASAGSDIKKLSLKEQDALWEEAKSKGL